MNIQDDARGQWEAESKKMRVTDDGGHGGGFQDRGERETKRKINSNIQASLLWLPNTKINHKIAVVDNLLRDKDMTKQ